jgi:RNA polymerase sigma factor (TIGR02999 family)
VTEVTHILSGLERGDLRGAAQLLPLVYDELRRLAAQKLADERPGQTLQPTALVHEAYLRLVGEDATHPWRSRGHFYAAAAEAMRRILISSWRRKHSLKRGGGWRRSELDELNVAASGEPDDLLALDEALTHLSEIDPFAAELVKLRFFAGLSAKQAALALGISSRSADRTWAYARAWLLKKIQES